MQVEGSATEGPVIPVVLLPNSIRQKTFQLIHSSHTNLSEQEDLMKDLTGKIKDLVFRFGSKAQKGKAAHICLILNLLVIVVMWF